MRRIIPSVGVLAIALGAWFGLRGLLPGGAERFYLLVPPTALAGFLIWSDDAWGAVRKRLILGTVNLSGLLLLAIAYACICAGPYVLTVADGWREIGIAWYFLIAVAILLTSLRVALRLGCRRLSARLPDGYTRRLTAGAMPLIVFYLVFAPYFMALTYVHRIKVPNYETPLELAGRDYEDVTFVTADGFTIRGWFIPAQATTSRTVLVCHGLGANRSQFLALLPTPDALDANALFFDFRGHGASAGHTVTMGYFERYDVHAAVNYLRSERPEQAKQIIGLGVSMGASALVQGAAGLEAPLDAVLLDSGFASAVDLTDSILNFVPSRLRPVLTVPGLALANLHAGCRLEDARPEAWIGNVRTPVLIVHCENDPLIPCSHAERLFASAAEPKTLLIAPVRGHGCAIGCLGERCREAAQTLFFVK